MAQAMNLTRRTFLKVGAAAGGGLLIGLYLPGYLGMNEETTAASEVFEPNVWIQIGTDDTVTITLTQLEMGQGVMTSMPMLIAEELDMDWQKLDTVWAPADPAYGNPGFGGSQSTAGSRSVRGMWKLFREAGATGRAMLVAAASQTWGVPENECSTEKGEVIHSSTGRRLQYGQLVEKASTLPVPEQVTLKDFDEFRLLGQPLARLDIPEKVNGSAVFGIDISRPNMLVARVVRCPVFEGKVKSFNADKAKAVPGVRHVIQISSGISVIADNYWAATKGVQALEIQWDEGPLAGLSSSDISKQLAELGQKTGAVARNVKRETVKY
jgi:isoquinoline 1-oxidoreductase beta subunit